MPYRSSQPTAGTIQFSIADCWLGSLLIATSSAGLCAVFIGDRPESLIEALPERFGSARVTEARTNIAEAVERVVRCVEHPASHFDLPLDLRGTEFQQRVWQALREIPAGTTRSYGQIAQHIDAPGSARAVARACGANPVAVIIPCHRVIGADGSLTGYRWGIDRKQRLLARDGYSIPK
ncbi:MAG: methylated-DNA--[protein]-cysteine S-methyltransferase [Gammaproteobacteria bacterium]